MNNVISIRQLKPLTKLEKIRQLDESWIETNWTNRLICIEDPFELTHNLGGRLDDTSTFLFFFA